MYVVIFRALTAQLDEQYLDAAKRMRELAIERYGCRAFHSVCEGEQEVSLSYWDDEQAIRAWKADAEHQLTQQYGRERWYQAYCVEIAKMDRDYRWSRDEVS